MQVMDWWKGKKELCTKKSVNVFLLSGLSQRAAQGIFISILKDSRSRFRDLHASKLAIQATATVTACSALVKKETKMTLHKTLLRVDK